MRRHLIPVLLCLLTLSACGGGDPSASPAIATVDPAASGASPQAATSTAVAASPGAPNKKPSLLIRSPLDEQSLAGPSITVTLAVTNFNVVSNIGGKPEAGKGHVHYYLDVDKIPTTAGKEATVEGEGRYVASPATTYTWNDIGPGEHKIGAQLIQNDHTPLEPPVTAEITITVE